MLNKKTILILITLLVGLSGLSYFVYKNSHGRNDTNSTVMVNNESSPTEQGKNDTSDQKNGTKGEIPDKPSSKPSPSTAEITNISENSNSKEVVVQTKLQGVGLKECSIMFTKGGSSFSEKAEVIYQPEFSTCAGFSIKTSKFPTGGNWVAILKVKKNDGSSIASASKNINVSKL